MFILWLITSSWLPFDLFADAGSDLLVLVLMLVLELLMLDGNESDMDISSEDNSDI